MEGKEKKPIDDDEKDIHRLNDNGALVPEKEIHQDVKEYTKKKVKPKKKKTR